MISVLYTIILITNFKLIEMCIKSSPSGEGKGEGQLGPVVLLVLLVVFSFLQQALSKYRVLNILLVFEYEAGNDSTQ